MLNRKRIAQATAVTAAVAAGVLIPAAGASADIAPQVTKGPTVIGSVFNGGTSVVVANDPPVGSGNVIGSP
jgi:hypothetical protein